jgi:hypothetical protein
MNVIPAVLIDSKKTWKLIKLSDKDLTAYSYKDVKHKLLVLDDDLESTLQYRFISIREFKKTHQTLGQITFNVCIPKK